MQRLILFIIIALCFSDSGMIPNCAAQTDGNAWVMGNKYLEFHCQRKGNRVAAMALVNRLVGRTIKLSADDFALHIEGRPSLHAADFSFERVAQEKIPGGQRLTLHLFQNGGTLKLAIVYELLDEDFFLRRHLEFSPALPMSLRQVEVCSVELAGKCSSQETGPPEYMRFNVWGVEGKNGFGQPVFLDDTFLGMEFRAGYNHYAGNAMTLSPFPGRTISGKFASKSVVLGVGWLAHANAEEKEIPVYFRNLRIKELP